MRSANTFVTTFESGFEWFVVEFSVINLVCSFFETAMTMKAQMKAALFVCMLVYLMEGGYCTGEQCSCVVNVPPPQLRCNSNGEDDDVAQQMQGPPGKRGPIGARGEKVEII